MNATTRSLWPPLLTVYEQAAARWRAIYPTRPRPFIDTTFRSNDEQQRLYNQGRTKPGRKVTNAMPGQSLHNYNPAFCFDLAFVDVAGKTDWTDQLFVDFNTIVQEIAPWVEWGGEWKSLKDRPHFQIRGYQWEDAKANRMPDFR